MPTCQRHIERLRSDRHLRSGRLDYAGCADFLNEASTTVIKTTLGQLRGLISGDVGYALPWAAQPIGFAVGTEFRKYKATQASDTSGQDGG